MTIGSVKNGGTVINSSNYTFVDNVLTIKAAYLSGLANGAKTITIGMLVGDGDLVEHVATVTVATGNTVDDSIETFSKAAPADVVFVITPDTGAEVSALKIGNDTVAVENYTYAAGTLTITDDYLATLDNGDVVFTAVMSKFNNVDMTVTVGD